MATFVLVPNPKVLAVQVVVFVAGYYAIKKLFVEPYMIIRDKREALTVGNKDEAVRALEEGASIATRIEARLAAVGAEAKQSRERKRDEALARRDSLISSAQEAARAEVAKVEGLIAADLASERSKIPNIISTLTDEVYALALA